jgi:dolichol-phosphate mannosyltransferase
MIPELTVIIPTLNERDNVVVLVDRLHACLKGIDWEAIFVDDDSTDGTLDALHRLARSDERIRYIRRVGRRGLSSACIEGMAASSAPFMAVMDADLQHDEGLLPKMLEKLRTGQFELAIGSRYNEGKISDDWSPMRRWMSRIGTRLGQIILRTRVSDPLSGLFMLTRDLFERAIHKISGKGFKILLDIVTSVGGDVRYVELPFVFGTRHAGKSKLDTLVIWEYAVLLLDKSIGRILPLRFVMFVGVGALGAMMHLGILWLFLKPFSMGFVVGQSVATFVAIGLNFILNNIFTYRDDRLKGWAVLRGLLFFYLICAFGAFVNVRVAILLFEYHIPWWIAGLLGAVVGAVWNYAVSSVFVWRRKKLQI